MKNDLYNGRNMDNEMKTMDPLNMWMNGLNLNHDWMQKFAGVNMRTDIVDLKDHYELKAELPGFKKDDIHISYHHNTLNIHAVNDLTNESHDLKGNVLSQERSSSNISRSFDLPNVDVKNIEADYNNGILKVNAPKIKMDNDIEIKVK